MIHIEALRFNGGQESWNECAKFVSSPGLLYAVGSIYIPTKHGITVCNPGGYIIKCNNELHVCSSGHLAIFCQAVIQEAAIKEQTQVKSPELSKLHKCEKCGSEEITGIVYCSGKSCRCRHGLVDGPTYKEHLQRTCAVCGYDWSEPCRTRAAEQGKKEL